MKEEYLWDKSGEPDPEVEQLEQILGTLKYQPRPLNLPEDINVVRRNRYLPLLAIAATLVVALLAGILWTQVKTEPTPQPRQAKALPEPVNPEKVSTPVKEEPRLEMADRKAQTFAGNRTQRPKAARRLTNAERQQAIEAKEQLLIAMRLASEKLNLAQRKTNSPASPGQIRNHHKVG
jgi:hypothetical protein